MYKRSETKLVRVGNLSIGGGSKISVQSMTNTDTRDIKKTISQIRSLEEAGCDLVRLAVVDSEAAKAIKEIKKEIKIPLVADIHFDYRLAILSMENGADKIRINPGNIGETDRVKKLVGVAKERDIPIRIGINAGSLEDDIRKKYGLTKEALVESALGHVKILEDMDFDKIVLSLKASDLDLCISSYLLMAEKRNYPLHIGVTEAGTLLSGTVKSSIGVGAMLMAGIGDTLRVSLTGDVVEEVTVGRTILQALNLGGRNFSLISCPSCGRTQIDLFKIAKEVEDALDEMDLKGEITRHIKVAVMGCIVNGPGEAREADIGIAGGKNQALLFVKGEPVRKLVGDNIAKEFIEEVRRIIS